MIEIIGLIVLGLIAGILAATLGIGGGIVIVPALVSIFAFSQLDAQGTSLAIIVPTTAVAAYAHAKAGRVEWRLVAILVGGGIFGAVAGARTALVLDEELLRRLFAVLLTVVAIRMALRARSLRAEATAGAPPSSASDPVDGS